MIWPNISGLDRRKNDTFVSELYLDLFVIGLLFDIKMSNIALWALRKRLLLTIVNESWFLVVDSYPVKTWVKPLMLGVK